MAKTVLLLFAALTTISVLSSCSADSPSSVVGANSYGTRSYKLDPEAAAVQLSIYGVQMGTPDAQKFQFLMRTLKQAGELVTLTEKAPGIEAGITMCGVFSSTANHDEVYELLRSIETDAKNTNFAAVSIDGCGG